MAPKGQAAFHKFISWLVYPVAVQPWFVLAFTVIGGLYPFLWNLLPSHPDKVVRFLVYTPITSFFFAYLFGWIVVACRGTRWLKGLFLLALWCVFVVDIGSLFSYGEGLSPVVAQLILQTTTGEASEFFSHYFAWSTWVAVILCGAVALALAIAGTLLPRKSRREIKHPIIVAGVVVVSLVVGSFWSTKLVKVMRQTTEYDLLFALTDPGIDPAISIFYQAECGDLVSKTIYATKTLQLLHKDAAGWEMVNREALDQKAYCATDSLDVIIVIGESFRKDLSSLYGCRFDTNPRLRQLRQKGSLVTFSDYITTYPSTSVSVKNAFSLNSLADGEAWNQAPFFPLIFKKAGFEVSLFDNQSLGAGDDFFSMTQGIALWDKFLVDSCYHKYNSQIYLYDGQLLTHEQPNDAPRRLTIYHLWGQHFDAGNRYPAGATAIRWNADSIDTTGAPWLSRKKRDYLAKVYNATLYNDSVMAEIYNKYAHRNAVAIYFSDHGVDLYDTPMTDIRSNFAPADADPVHWMHANFDIPMMVWMSDEYIRRYPQKVADLKAASSKPGMLDNLGQLALSLSGIESPYYRPERDILSPQYEVLPRVTRDGRCYDQIVRSKGAKEQRTEK